MIYAFKVTKPLNNIDERVPIYLIAYHANIPMHYVEIFKGCKIDFFR